MTKIPDLLIVGTDTGVGKSVVSLLTMQLLYRRGFYPFYVKPFQTGCRDAYALESDAAFVYRHIRELSGSDPTRSMIYCYTQAKAPYYAARDAGERIDMDEVVLRINRQRKQNYPLVVEAAGGLMVPLTDKLLLLDAIERLGCRPLLVARSGLGTINHTLLSIETLQRRGVLPIGVVMVTEKGADQDPQLVAENMKAVQDHGGVAVGGVIPRIKNFGVPPAAAYAPLKQLLFPYSPED